MWDTNSLISISNYDTYSNTSTWDEFSNQWRLPILGENGSYAVDVIESLGSPIRHRYAVQLPDGCKSRCGRQREMSMHCTTHRALRQRETDGYVLERVKTSAIIVSSLRSPPLFSSDSTPPLLLDPPRGPGVEKEKGWWGRITTMRLECLGTSSDVPWPHSDVTFSWYRSPKVKNSGWTAGFTAKPLALKHLSVCRSWILIPSLLWSTCDNIEIMRINERVSKSAVQRDANVRHSSRTVMEGSWICAAQPQNDRQLPVRTWYVVRSIRMKE